MAVGESKAGSSPSPDWLAGKRLGRYEVLTRLGAGGMAMVYVARVCGMAGFERLLAIKVLHPNLAHEQTFISMFLDEARLAALIHHVNVVSTIDISDTPDVGYFIVMDYIEGDHLGELMRQADLDGGRMPERDSLRIIVDALNGLAAAHELTDENGRHLGLVHRDVSPQNILVGADGVARLTDFGVAKAETRISNSLEGVFKGKLSYMAPERAISGYADQRSDLFAMGIVLWECLTGRRLFRADNPAAIVNMLCRKEIPLPSSVDGRLSCFDPVLKKALEREPGLRFQSAAEFVDAIERVAEPIGGLGSRRSVADMVKRYASDKLARDRALIRRAFAEISAKRGKVERREPTAPEDPWFTRDSFAAVAASARTLPDRVPRARRTPRVLTAPHPPRVPLVQSTPEPAPSPVQPPVTSPGESERGHGAATRDFGKRGWIVGGIGAAIVISLAVAIPALHSALNGFGLAYRYPYLGQVTAHGLLGLDGSLAVRLKSRRNTGLRSNALRAGEAEGRFMKGFWREESSTRDRFEPPASRTTGADEEGGGLIDGTSNRERERLPRIDSTGARRHGRRGGNALSEGDSTDGDIPDNPFIDLDPDERKAGSRSSAATSGQGFGARGIPDNPFNPPGRLERRSRGRSRGAESVEALDGIPDNPF